MDTTTLTNLNLHPYITYSQNQSRDISLNQLLGHYSELEKELGLRECFKYGKLVYANGNSKTPIHRWYHMKEAYSSRLLEELINDWKIDFTKIKTLLDPFCGSGTTLLSAQALAKKYHNDDLRLIGYEVNPFIHFVASTKLRWFDYDVEIFSRNFKRLLKIRKIYKDLEVPGLSTLSRQDVFSAIMLKKALNIRKKILANKKNEKDLLLIGFANILEGISGVRKDGRALRIIENKQKVNFYQSLEDNWKAIEQDLTEAKSTHSQLEAVIYKGDGRTLLSENDTTFKGKTDLIVYSPPYLNNFDYTEVYKIELWMCGFVSTNEEFKNIRAKTFRSHPSIRFGRPLSLYSKKNMKEVTLLINEIIDLLPKDNLFERRALLIKEYFDDTFISLSNQFNVLNEGSFNFCIVGNSVHGSIPIATDLIIALIAKLVGFRVASIDVARYKKHRVTTKNQKHFIRESIIVMEKPLC